MSHSGGTVFDHLHNAIVQKVEQQMETLSIQDVVESKELESAIQISIQRFAHEQYKKYSKKSIVKSKVFYHGDSTVRYIKLPRFISGSKTKVAVYHGSFFEIKDTMVTDGVETLVKLITEKFGPQRGKRYPESLFAMTIVIPTEIGGNFFV